MSRNTIYCDNRLTIVEGVDHVLGQFYQIFDRELQHETDEGEGLILDWSSLFGFEVNLTGYPNSLGIESLIGLYKTDNSDISEPQCTDEKLN